MVVPGVRASPTAHSGATWGGFEEQQIKPAGTALVRPSDRRGGKAGRGEQIRHARRRNPREWRGERAGVPSPCARAWRDGSCRRVGSFFGLRWGSWRARGARPQHRVLRQPPQRAARSAAQWDRVRGGPCALLGTPCRGRRSGAQTIHQGSGAAPISGGHQRRALGSDDRGGVKSTHCCSPVRKRARLCAHAPASAVKRREFASSFRPRACAPAAQVRVVCSKIGPVARTRQDRRAQGVFWCRPPRARATPAARRNPEVCLS